MLYFHRLSPYISCWLVIKFDQFSEKNDHDGKGGETWWGTAVNLINCHGGDVNV